MDERAMRDFHSHILPGIDDGSRSVEESLKMLEMLKCQGVSAVMATPHFNADRVDVDIFLARRQKSLDALMAVASPDMPQIRLGAEVSYYPGISRHERIGNLCIDGTKLLLLEMPMGKWEKHVIEELINLPALCGIIPVVAHIERCLPYQERRFLERFGASDVLFQVNASFIINRSTRRRAIGLFKKRLVHFIGSDCHDAVSRPPEIGNAYKIISDRLGDGFLGELLDYESMIIGKQ